MDYANKYFNEELWLYFEKQIVKVKILKFKTF